MRIGVGLTLAIAAGALAWWGLGRLEPRASWLRVEAPPRAVFGQKLSLRVHVGPLPEPTCLCVDLHWAAQHDGPSDYLSGGGFQRVGKEGGDFDFTIPVPPREGARFVLGVIFLSPTGRWNDHTLLADTEHIPVAAPTGQNLEAPLAPIGVNAQRLSLGSHSRGAKLLRGFTGLLLLVAAFLNWRGRGSPSEPATAPGMRCRHWLAVLLALACVWELCGLEGWAGSHVRALARAQDVYYLRAGLQKVVVCLIIATVLAMLLYLRRARSVERWAFVVLGLYAGLAAISLVSLHAIDHLAWAGVSVVQLLKLGSAAVLLWLTQRFGAVARNQSGADGS